MNQNRHTAAKGADALISASRLLLLMTLVYSPWAFGSTPPWTVDILNMALFAACGLWLCGQLLRRFTGKSENDGRLAPGLLWPAAALLLLGWGRVFNPISYYDVYQQAFYSQAPVLPGWPGTVDQTTSMRWMMRLTGLLFAMILAGDMAAHRKWRSRMLVAMAVTGVSIALFGIAQKIVQAPLLLWEPGDFFSTSFATYRYHGNAGAFLNLIWPLCGALTYAAFRDKAAFLRRALWVPAAMVVLAGVFINTSKGAHAVGLVLVMGAIAMGARFIKLKRHRMLEVCIATLIGLAGFAVLLHLIGPGLRADRWASEIQKGIFNNARVQAGEVSLHIVRDAPWLGFGPDTFSLVFPSYSRIHHPSLKGFWLHAHCDYLQFAVDWGLVGALVFAAIFAGGMRRLAVEASASRKRIQRNDWKSRTSSAEADAKTSDARNEAHQHGEPAGRREQSLTAETAAMPRMSSSTTRILDGAVFLSLAGVTIHAVFDFPLQIASIQLYAAALLGIAWRRRDNRGDVPRS